MRIAFLTYIVNFCKSVLIKGLLKYRQVYRLKQALG